MSKALHMVISVEITRSTKWNIGSNPIELQTTATLVVLICNIIVVIMGLFVARSAINRFRFGNVYDLWMKFLSGENQKHYAHVRQLLQRDLSKQVLIDVIQSDYDIKTSVLYFVDHWSVLATAVRYGLFDREQAIWMNYQHVIYFFVDLRPWLCYRLLRRRLRAISSTILAGTTWNAGRRVIDFTIAISYAKCRPFFEMKRLRKQSGLRRTSRATMDCSKIRLL